MTEKRQTDRIREKLGLARERDPGLKVFGARSHKYQIGPPVSPAAIEAFEAKYSAALPPAYTTFLLDVGNGGTSPGCAAAGPFYGIYPLGAGVDELLDEPEVYLQQPVRLYPGMTDRQWDALTGRIADEDAGDAAFNERLGERWSGILPLGSQGCTYLHALLLNGKHAGRVVNLDMGRQKPVFTYEANFLDWYERWLDEIISGDLLADNSGWFGYCMGGNDKDLLTAFHDADDDDGRYDAIRSMSRLAAISDASAAELRDLCCHNGDEIRRMAVGLLTRFRYKLAIKPLTDHLNGDDNDCLAACRAIMWYAKDRAPEWLDLLRTRLPRIDAEQTFRFAAYVLAECDAGGRHLLPFCRHPNEKIRVHAFLCLGRLEERGAFLQAFEGGLHDDSSAVVDMALRGLRGVDDARLLPVYRQVFKRFGGEPRIITTLTRRLQALGQAGKDLLAELQTRP